MNNYDFVNQFKEYILLTLSGFEHSKSHYIKGSYSFNLLINECEYILLVTWYPRHQGYK